MSGRPRALAHSCSAQRIRGDQRLGDVQTRLGGSGELDRLVIGPRGLVRFCLSATFYRIVTNE